MLSMLVIEHYLDASEPVLAFVYRRRIVAIEREVFQGIRFHTYGVFATVIQSHQLHPSAVNSPVQHEFDSMGPLPHAAVSDIANLLHHTCATPLTNFFISCLTI